MKLPRYELVAEKTLRVFEFTSEGPKGRIKKLIKFSETALKGYYNLAFGDKDIEVGDIDDRVVSNNGDSEQVLATVVSAVYMFTEVYRDVWVYATGSTKARTRLYRFIEWGLPSTLTKWKKIFMYLDNLKVSGRNLRKI